MAKIGKYFLQKFRLQHFCKSLNVIPGIVLFPEYAVGFGYRLAVPRQWDAPHGGIEPFLLPNHIHRQIALPGNSHQPCLLQGVRKAVLAVQTHNGGVVRLLLLSAVGVDGQNAGGGFQFLRLDLRKVAQRIPG